MTEFDNRVERLLHAYVDGELSPPEKHRLLLRMEKDERIREQTCDLQRTKEWVKFSFEGESAPTRTLPKGKLRTWLEVPTLRVAASVLMILVAFGAGLAGHAWRGFAPGELALGDTPADSNHVILHIGESNERRFSDLIATTREILERFRDSGTQVEVVANAGGLDLLRTSTSSHIDTIKSMINAYDNVRFIACSKGLSRLKQQGLDTTLIEGVSADEPAADHLIQRLSERWSYIQI
jgi:intracellular sulfur oxidation DsrE/DsrF family protein